MSARRAVVTEGPAPEAAAVLALLGPPDRQPPDLPDTHWTALGALARDHRLGPHLHARLGRGEIVPAVPSWLAGEWRAAHRAAGLAALVQRREALALGRLLARAGIRPVALKGAWLAWHAYPAPAERPLRDLDLWVDAADGVRAFELLLAHGLEPPAGAARSCGAKHYPPLLAASGTAVELHVHLWEPPGTMEWPTPRLRDAAFAQRTIADAQDDLRYLAPQDLLAHLAIHAAYSHRLEVGPLLLSDIDFLAARAAIDWPRFWHEAEAGGYLRGAALCLALCDRWRRPGIAEQSAMPLVVGEATLAQASALLLQPLDARRATRSLAALRSGLADGGTGRAVKVAISRAAGIARDPVRLARRMGDSLRALGNPAVVASARQSAAIGTWLEGDGAPQ